MNNPRLKGVVNRFADNKQVEGNLSDKFQIFSNYILLKEQFCQINEDYPYESDLNISLLEDINFGKNSTMAVDGCFFIYKKEILHLGIDKDELKEKFASFTEGDLHIVLIQTKSGKLFTTDLSTLSDCLDTLFEKQEEWKKFVELRELCNELLESNHKINIKFYCYYVEGDKTDDNIFNNPTFKVRIEALKKVMKDFFWIKKDNDVIIDFYNDDKIYSIYENQELSLNVITKTVQYVNITSEIEIKDIGKILFGAISFGELMKIIFDKDKNRRNELYGYNVRDEVKNSTIKNEIIKTIKEKGEQFILLNNGITFIVDRQEKRGERGIHLENIRIVNGCQTCNAIINVCKNTEEFNNIQVNIKIIETQKDEILLGNITYSSNNQNAVTKENLISIEPKMFQLEKAFKDFDLEKTTSLDTIFFERREGQYRGQNIKYIDTLALAKAYVATWEGLPHECLMYRESVLEKFMNNIKNDDENIKKALIAGVLWYNIYKQIPPLYDNARYHIFSVITRNDTNISNLDISTITKEFIDNEIKLVIKAIEQCKDYLGDPLFPPLTTRGKIHYRKFYPSTALTEIETEYKKLKNANTPTNN